MSALELVVIGMGMVSPVALGAREHAFVIRAEGSMSAARAFVDSAGSPLDVLHCPAVDPTLPAATRVATLGAMALREALAPLEGWRHRAALRATFCPAAPWEAFSAEDTARCEQRWADELGLTFGPRHPGATGIYDALVAAPLLFERASALAIVAVDSYASPSAIAARLRPASRWEPVPPRLAEAAVALVVTTPSGASGLERLGEIRFAATAPGTSSDLDEHPIDDHALTALLRQAMSGAPSPLGNAFGPTTVDDLRRRSFHQALVRNTDVVALDMQPRCVEHSIGRVGAAAGAAHLVYALACQHHGLLAHPGSTIAWALSRDGRRGVGRIAP